MGCSGRPSSRQQTRSPSWYALPAANRSPDEGPNPVSSTPLYRDTHARLSAGRRAATRPEAGSDGACDAGRQDVVDVPVELEPCPVVAHGDPRVGVARADLNIAQGCPGVEQLGDVGVAQTVRGDPLADPGGPASLGDQARGGVPVEPAARSVTAAAARAPGRRTRRPARGRPGPEAGWSPACRPCRRPARPGDRALRRGRRCRLRRPRRRAARASRADSPARRHQARARPRRAGTTRTRGRSGPSVRLSVGTCGRRTNWPGLRFDHPLRRAVPVEAADGRDPPGDGGRSQAMTVLQVAGVGLDVHPGGRQRLNPGGSHQRVHDFKSPE